MPGTATQHRLDDDAIAVISISRAEQRNAFTEELADDLIAEFTKASSDDKVRVIILTGDPRGKNFCAGADLGGNGAQFKVAPGADYDKEYRDGGGRIGLVIMQCPKPVVCAINGNAVGVGLTMPCCCDVRVVDEKAKVGFPFVRRGLASETISSWTLPRLVGLGHANELVLTGRVFTAKDAPHGLFNHVVPASQVMPKALELAREMAANASPQSMALSKNLMMRSQLLSPEEAHLNESKAILQQTLSPHSMEGIMSFLEKRAPRFPNLTLDTLDRSGWTGPRVPDRKAKL